MKTAIVAMALVAGALGSCARTAAVEPPAGRAVTGAASVIDGDTMEMGGQRLRLHGIDAPEAGQTCTGPDGARWRCGNDAALALADRIGARPVACEPQDMDRYGRIVAICRLAGEDLNRWMVEAGWAVAYRSYSRDYVPAEEDARAAGRGIWAGAFDMPWTWRRRS